MEIHCDGYTYMANPSPIGGGFTVVNGANDLLLNEEVLKVGLTNNEAELLACNAAVKLAEMKDTIVVDSKIVVYWLNGRGKKRQDLRHLKEETIDILASKGLKLEWRPRDKNLAGIYNEKVLDAENSYEVEDADLSWIK